MMNIIRHANPSEVVVSFQMDGEMVHLEIRDNGKGFVVPDRWIDLVRDGHLGLAGIAERTEALGGILDVVSAPGQGTMISVNIPREEAELVRAGH
jgi:signal transduction histidine kinase